MLSSRKIIQDTRYLFSSSIIAKALNAIAGILTARVLGPADYGLLKIINYIPSLAKFGSIGFTSVALREIPHARGSRLNANDENKIRNTSFSSELIWAITLSIFILLFSFVYDRPEIRYGIIIVSFTLLFTSLNKKIP